MLSPQDLPPCLAPCRCSLYVDCFELSSKSAPWGDAVSSFQDSSGEEYVSCPDTCIQACGPNPARLGPFLSDEVQLIKVTHTLLFCQTPASRVQRHVSSFIVFFYSRSMKHKVEPETIRIFSPHCQLLPFPWANSVLALINKLLLGVYSEPVTE